VNVLVLVGDIGEDDSTCDLLTRPTSGGVLEVRFSRCREAEEPKDRVRVLPQDVEPDAEDEWVDLVRGSKREQEE
jgi:hypothetical protein